MKKIHYLLILLFAGILITAFLFFPKTEIQKKVEFKKSPEKTGLKSKTLHPLVFFNKDTFLKGVEKSKNNKAFGYKIAGGTTPHDLYPGFIIADFYSKLAFQKPKTIIIIGPNHYEKGNFYTLTSLGHWQTSFGIVDPDFLVIDKLLKAGVVKVDEQVLEEDHAVSGSMSFIKYYLPDAKVVPILLSGKMSKKQIELFSEEIKNVVDEETVVVAAVDFSHYLSSEEARKKDDLTLYIMKNKDYRQLLNLNNDYVDSPPSIAALLMIMDFLKKPNMKILNHTNSGELQKNNTIETTSYFETVFY